MRFVLGRRIEWKTYSGLCPTSTNATSGPSSAENTALICGNAARTSGHQGCFVAVSAEDIKAMKNLDFGSLLGNVRRFAEVGAAKLVETGILFFWWIFLGYYY